MKRKMKNTTERLICCLLVSLVAIPGFIVFSVGFVQGVQDYRSGISEKEFIYEKSTPYSLSRFSNGIKVYAVDESDNDVEIFYPSSFLEDIELSDYLKTGDKITVSFFTADYADNATDFCSLGVKTTQSVICDTQASVKDYMSGICLYLFFALFSLAFEILFIVFSKKIFKDKRITKRTDRPVTDDLFKESLFE